MSVCPHCKKELQILGRAFKNLESYHPGGGRVLTATECCNKPVYLYMVQKFQVEKYTGEASEDDWGVTFKTKKK